MACLNFQNTYFKKHLLMAAFILLEALVFQNTSKWMHSSLSNLDIFYSEYFYLKNHPKTHTLILTSMRRGSSIIAFHYVFIITFYAATRQNFFLLAKHRV